MNQLFLKVLCTLMLGFMSSISIAAMSDQQVDRLLQVSGFTKQTESLPEQMKAGILQGVQQGQPLPDAAVQSMLKSADKTILPSVILGEVHFLVQNALADDDVQSLFAWYNSDVGKHITAIEEKAATVEAYEHMMSLGSSLLENTAHVERAKRFDELMRATEMMMELQEFIATAAFSAAAGGTPIDLNAFRTQMKSMQPQMRQQMRQVVIASYVYTYRDIDEESMAQYEAFLRQPATEAFNNAAMLGLTMGLKKILANWIHDFSPQIEKEFEESESSPSQ